MTAEDLDQALSQKDMLLDRPYVATHNGLRVPWVTRWSKEVIPFGQHDLSAGMYGDAFGREYLGFKLEGNYRDKRSLVERSVLWLPEDNHNQGRGEANFSQVSTTRQRLCMRYLRCQVCGMPVQTGPLRWLMPKSSAHPMTNFPGAVASQSPPVCEGCIPVALRLCPHLKTHDWTILVEPDVGLVGVTGYVGQLKHGQVIPFEGAAPYVDGSLFLPADTAVLAKQQMVSLSGYTEETA